MRFIVDQNVGKLCRWLRMLGYDTLFFTGREDWEMIITALKEGRIILTRDTRLMDFGVISSGRVQALLIASEIYGIQKRQLLDTLELDTESTLFSRCLECNTLLEKKPKEQLAGRIPPYVFKTQEDFVECPGCKRVYWKGTHVQAMERSLRHEP